MKITFDKNIAQNNLIKIKENSRSKVAFLIKSQLLFSSIRDILRNEVLYTTNEVDGAINIYNDSNIVVVDAFDRREGILMEEAEKLREKETAIVNFCCCSNDVEPTAQEVSDIHKTLKEYGFKKVSVGGSLLLDYDIEVDEIRVGEAFLTGYSTIYNTYFKGCENPFTIRIDIEKETESTYLINRGFLELGGFTNCKAICVNTSYSVFKKDVEVENGQIILKPDYYTLIKLADKNLLP
jgi:hypothetical protein